MNNQILIIALILMALWIYYQKNNNTPVLSENQAQITNLQREIQHYQTLYQKRVAKDITADQSAKISQLTQHIQELESSLAGVSETKSLYSQKIGDLEQQLANLAHQKIKNQKEAQTLLNQLETNWKAEKTHWQKEDEKLSQGLTQERKEFYGQIESLQKKVKEMEEWSKGQHNRIVELDKNNQKTQDHQQVILNKIDNFLKL